MVFRDNPPPAPDVARFLYLMVWRAVRSCVLLGRRRAIPEASGRHRGSPAGARTCFLVVRFCNCSGSGLVLLSPANHRAGNFRDSFCGRDLGRILTHWNCRRFSSDRPTPGPKLRDQKHGSLAWIALGAVVCWIIYCIPVIGFLAGSLVFLTGLGAFSLYVVDRARGTPTARLN